MSVKLLKDSCYDCMAIIRLSLSRNQTGSVSHPPLNDCLVNLLCCLLLARNFVETFQIDLVVGTWPHAISGLA